MKMCGNDGAELRCCKTGMILRDERYVGVHHADMFFCPTCHSVFINRADGEDFGSNYHDALLPVGGKIIYGEDFRNKIETGYGLEL